jgi:hypothetical protein
MDVCFAFGIPACLPCSHRNHWPRLKALLNHVTRDYTNAAYYGSPNTRMKIASQRLRYKRTRPKSSHRTGTNFESRLKLPRYSHVKIILYYVNTTAIEQTILATWMSSLDMEVDMMQMIFQLRCEDLEVQKLPSSRLAAAKDISTERWISTVEDTKRHHCLRLMISGLTDTMMKL